MKAENILLASAVTLIMACSSGQDHKRADAETHQDASVMDSVTPPESNAASGRTSSLSGSSSSGTLTDTADVNGQKPGRQNNPATGKVSTRTSSLSGSAGTGTLTDTDNVKKPKPQRQKIQ